MPVIKFCPARVFLDDYLPEEMTYITQKLTGGGHRVLLYWDKNIQENKDGSQIFFKEFGREYLGDHNTNEPHDRYIRLTLEAISKAVKILGFKPTFEVDDIMNKIPWQEKEKPSAWTSRDSDL